MAESPDQFQRHIRVRFPIADRFLGTPREAEAAALDLRNCFRRPLLSITIPQRPVRAPAVSARRNRDNGDDTER